MTEKRITTCCPECHNTALHRVKRGHCYRCRNCGINIPSDGLATKMIHKSVGSPRFFKKKKEADVLS